MHYPIPINSSQMLALKNRPVDEEMVAVAIAGVIKLARSNGQSLDDLTAEVLADDPLLDSAQRGWLSKIITQVWQNLP